MTSAPRGDRADDFRVSRIGVGAHFLVGAILDRVRHQNPLGSEAERAGLRFCSAQKFTRGHEHRWDAPPLQVADVVHTARRAAPSIGKGLDENIAFRGDLLA